MGGIEIKSFTLVLNLSSSETELQVIFFTKKIIKDNFEAPDLTSIITKRRTNRMNCIQHSELLSIMSVHKCEIVNIFTHSQRPNV